MMSDFFLACCAAVVAVLFTAGLFSFKTRKETRTVRIKAEVQAQRIQRLACLRRIIAEGQEATATAQRVAQLSVDLAKSKETLQENHQNYIEAKKSIEIFARQNLTLEKITGTMENLRDFETVPLAQLEVALEEILASHEALRKMLKDLEAQAFPVFGPKHIPSDQHRDQSRYADSD